MEYTNNKLIDLLEAFIKYPLSSCQEVLDSKKVEDALVKSFIEIRSLLSQSSKGSAEELKLLGRLIVREMTQKDPNGHKIKVLKSIHKKLGGE